MVPDCLCPACDARIEGDSRFCPECGTSLEPRAVEASRLARIEPDEPVVRDTPPSSSSSSSPGFWPVRIDKFLVLSISTLGLYDLVWFWRNWRAVNQAAPGSVRPILRTIFAGITHFDLVGRVGVPGGVLLAIGYFVTNALARLPDPWWLLSLGSFVFLVPTIHSINRRCRDPDWPPSSRWRVRDGALAAVTVPVVVLIWIGVFMPEYTVLRGSELDPGQIAVLRDAELLFEGEEIVYYCPTDPQNVLQQGAFISDVGLTFWWTDPVTSERQVAFMTYDRIDEIEVNRAETWFDDTWVRVTDIAGDWVSFPLAGEDGLDMVFVDELRRRIAAASTSPGPDV